MCMWKKRRMSALTASWRDFSAMGMSFWFFFDSPQIMNHDHNLLFFYFSLIRMRHPLPTFHGAFWIKRQCVQTFFCRVPKDAYLWHMTHQIPLQHESYYHWMLRDKYEHMLCWRSRKYFDNFKAVVEGPSRQVWWESLTIRPRACVTASVHLSDHLTRVFRWWSSSVDWSCGLTEALVMGDIKA